MTLTITTSSGCYTKLGVAVEVTGVAQVYNKLIHKQRSDMHLGELTTVQKCSVLFFTKTGSVRPSLQFLCNFYLPPVEEEGTSFCRCWSFLLVDHFSSVQVLVNHWTVSIQTSLE